MADYPAGSVNVLCNGEVVETIPVGDAGYVDTITSALPVGADPLTFQFLGDAGTNAAPSESGPQTETVTPPPQPRPTTTTLNVPDPPTSVQGTPVRLTGRVVFTP